MLPAAGTALHPPSPGDRAPTDPLKCGVYGGPGRLYGAPMPTTLRGAASALEAIETLAGAGLPAGELLVEASRRIDRVVPSDGHFLAATDPQTTLCIGAGVVMRSP